MSQHNPSRRRHIEVLLDRSGSMESIQSDATGGLWAFMEEQRAVPGDTTLTLWLFNHEIERVIDTVSISEPLKFTLRPQGTTALLDAIGQSLTMLEKRLSKIPKTWHPEEMIVVIVTDGRENSSIGYDRPFIKRLISARREAGWQFVFLAADEEAFDVADGMGIGPDTVLPMERDRTKESMTSLGRMVARGTQTGHYAFTDDERRTAH
jgi:uncharacterized protein YegL